jgi:hypothetical protein
MFANENLALPLKSTFVNRNAACVNSMDLEVLLYVHPCPAYLPRR